MALLNAFFTDSRLLARRAECGQGAKVVDGSEPLRKRHCQQRQPLRDKVRYRLLLYIVKATAYKDTLLIFLLAPRLDQDNLIFRGGEDEASGALLRGSLVLCLSDSLRLQSVRMRFTGEKRIA